MRDDERRALDAVREEYAYLNRLLLRQSDANPAVVRHLEATYLLRLYAGFEAILRRRLRLPTDDDRTLVNCIQRLSGENVGYDPAKDGNALAWWRLFRRDRNVLAHGRSLVPAIGLDATRTLMEVYLSGL